MSAFKPVHVLRGVVVATNDDGSVTVEREDGRGYIHHVLPMRIGANPLQGAGDLYIPSLGEVCYVMYPSDGSRPFIAGYAMPLEPATQPGSTAKHSGGTYPKLYSGDRLISGFGRNYVCVRQSGVVEIVSTPLSSIMLIPTENLIRATFSNLDCLSPLGRVLWRGPDSGEAMFVWDINDSQGGPAIVQVRAGHLADGKHAAGSSVLAGAAIKLEFTIRPSGKVFAFRVDEEGQYSVESAGSGYLHISKAWEGKIDDKALLSVGANGITVTSDGNVSISGKKQFKLNVDISIELASQQIGIAAEKVVIGRGAYAPAVRSDALIPILAELCSAAERPDLIPRLTEIMADTVFIA